MNTVNIANTRIIETPNGKADFGEKDYMVFIVPMRKAVLHKNTTNAVKVARKIIEIKNYRQNGSKYWTRTPGFEIYFVVPKNKIEFIIKDNNNSWVDFVIEDVVVKTGSDIFSLKYPVYTLVDISVKAIATLNNVANKSGVLPDTLDTSDTSDSKDYNSLLAEKDCPSYAKALISNGHQIVVDLMGREDDPATLHQIIGRNFVGKWHGYDYTIKPRQIDWLKTAQRNEWDLENI